MLLEHRLWCSDRNNPCNIKSVCEMDKNIQIDKVDEIKSDDTEDVNEERVQTENEEQTEIRQCPTGLRATLRSITSWSNYMVYLITAWVFNAFAALQSFLNLYLYTLQWDYFLLGVILTIVSLTAAVMRLLGGYTGDVINRKTLSVVAMLLMSIYWFMLGLTRQFIFIIIGLMAAAITEIAKGGSSAYVMDNIPKENSGFALSLFTAGNALGIVTLVAFVYIIPTLGFSGGFQIIHLIGGIALLCCAIARAHFLTPSTTPSSKQRIGLRDFLHANWRAFKTVCVVMPGALLIATIDALSDSLFNFGAVIYVNQVLRISVPAIAFMLITTLLVSVPLLIKVGRVADLKSTRRAGLIVYSFMPPCAALLFLAPYIPYWVPLEFVTMANLAYPGLEVIFATPFLAVVMKHVSDTLWWLVLLTMIQKNLPRTDTSKILAVFWTVVYVCASVGPLIAGLIFAAFNPSLVFLVILGLNLIILSWTAHYGLSGRERTVT